MKPTILAIIAFAMFRREALSNSTAATAREAAVANAADPNEAIDFAADGWFKISPYGVFRGATPARQQHVSQVNARAMEAEFNSLLGSLGRLFRGIPIYHGHPDVDPELWPDDRRIGKVTKLEARADGLWGFAEWNSLGRENQTEGWWIYPSPRWDAPTGGRQFAPDRLISIGLTNTPRIAESEPVFNSAAAAAADTASTDEETETEIPMDPKLIRTKLGLAPEATDEEVLAKLDTVIAAATASEGAATELENAKAAKDTMACSLAARDAKIISLREALDNALLDAAQRDARITPAERPAWAAKLAGDDRETQVNALADLKPQLNGKALDLANARAGRADADNLREAVANAVTKLQKDEGIDYDTAWGRVKKDAKFKPYFEK